MESQADSGSISLEQFAAVNAALDAGLPREDILAEAGLSREAWGAAQEQWLSKLAAQVAQGRLATNRRYARLVSAHKILADVEARDARKQIAGTMPVAPEARMSPLLISRAPRLVPTADLDLDRAPPPPIAPPAIEAPPIVPAAPALPFVRADAALPFTRSEPTPAVDSALPFTRARPAPVVDNALPFARVEPAPIVDNALPFARAKAAPVVDTALPFAPVPTSAARAETPSEHWALPFQRLSTVAPAPEPAAAAESLREEGAALLEYANVCAGLRAHPAHVAWVLHQFGLDATSWATLNALWTEHLERDPVLLDQWHQIVEQYTLRWIR